MTQEPSMKRINNKISRISLTKGLRFGVLLVPGLILFTLPILAAEKSFDPDASPEEFANWQEQTRAFLLDVLYNGPLPEAVPLKPTFGRKETRDNYGLIEVTFHDRPGHITTGWLAKPLNPSAEKLPAVIALHGHDWIAYDTFDPDNMYYYGDLFASKGYIVFSLNIEHEHLDYINPVFIHFRWPLPKNVPFPHMGQRVWMIKRAIDFLETQPDVDIEKIGVVGLSNGGMSSMFAAAADARIKVCVASGSLIMHRRMWHRELIHCRCQYLDKMAGELDYYDVFALIAPRPLVVQSGERDPIFPIESAREAYAYIEKAYAIAGASEKVIHDIHDGAHSFRAEVPLQWFDRYMPLPGQAEP
jgi:dienelactone hydrolase